VNEIKNIKHIRNNCIIILKMLEEKEPTVNIKNLLKESAYTIQTLTDYTNILKENIKLQNKIK
jgi:hypothetical protein